MVYDNLFLFYPQHYMSISYTSMSYSDSGALSGLLSVAASLHPVPFIKCPLAETYRERRK